MQLPVISQSARGAPTDVLSIGSDMASHFGPARLRRLSLHSDVAGNNDITSAAEKRVRGWAQGRAAAADTTAGTMTMPTRFFNAVDAPPLHTAWIKRTQAEAAMAEVKWQLRSHFEEQVKEQLEAKGREIQQVVSDHHRDVQRLQERFRLKIAGLEERYQHLQALNGVEEENVKLRAEVGRPV